MITVFKTRKFKIMAVITALLAILTVLSAGCGDKSQPNTTKETTQEITKENVVPTNTANQPTTVTDVKEIKMDAGMKKKLNTFFSNFSEAQVKPFEKGKVGDENLIRFGVLHVILNSEKLIEYKGTDKNTGYIKTANVDGADVYYFGLKPQKYSTVEDYTYENGYYKFPRASGEMYTFSQIDKLYDLGNNTYKAEVSIYNASSGFSGDPQGTMSDWKATGEVPDLKQKINATIQKVSENGQERYLLLEYK